MYTIQHTDGTVQYAYSSSNAAMLPWYLLLLVNAYGDMMYIYYMYTHTYIHTYIVHTLILYDTFTKHVKGTV